MAKNYFDHEIEVKYVEGILNKNQNWDWYIDYVENNFDIDFNIASNNDFDNIFFHVQKIYQHLIKINENNYKFTINKTWLKNLNLLSLYYLNKFDENSLDFDNDFFLLMELYIKCAKIINEQSQIKYICYSQIFKNYNIFEIIDLSEFEYRTDEILDLIKKLKLNFIKEKNIFLDNVNNVFHSCEKINPKLLKLSNDYNCFSYKDRSNKIEDGPWEEAYLLEILNSKYEDGKLNPLIEYKDGTSYPDINKFNSTVLSHMKNYFANTQIMFLIESLEYTLYKLPPNDETIKKHLKLVEENIKEFSEDKGFHYLKCTSLEFAIEFFNDNNINLKDDCLKDFIKNISNVNNIAYYSYLRSKKIPIGKKLVNKLIKYKIDKANDIDKINDESSFILYIEDSDIISIVDNEIFSKISDKFEYVLSLYNEKNPIDLSSLFISYLIFLLKIKNNKSITSNDISTEIIFIRGLWKEEYYNKSFNSLQHFKQSVKIDNDKIIKTNNLLINHPQLYARYCINLSEKSVSELLESISKNALLALCTHTIITEDFPMVEKFFIDDRHQLDTILFNQINQILKKNQYRLLNKFDTTTYVQQIYNYIKQNIRFMFSLFNDTKALYDLVQTQNKEYQLVEYSEEVTLAHLTQLFPIVENKIREIGEIFGISPICENVNKYHKLKEPSSVLIKIINFIHSETKDIMDSIDFIFIFFTLFAENGLNIRNDCIHGNHYNTNLHEINYAFKITLFCLHLLENRFTMIRNALSSK